MDDATKDLVRLCAVLWLCLSSCLWCKGTMWANSRPLVANDTISIRCWLHLSESVCSLDRHSDSCGIRMSGMSRSPAATLTHSRFPGCRCWSGYMCGLCPHAGRCEWCCLRNQRDLHCWVPDCCAGAVWSACGDMCSQAEISDLKLHAGPDFRDCLAPCDSVAAGTSNTDHAQGALPGQLMWNASNWVALSPTGSYLMRRFSPGCMWWLART